MDIAGNNNKGGGKAEVRVGTVRHRIRDIRRNAGVACPTVNMAQKINAKCITLTATGLHNIKGYIILLGYKYLLAYSTRDSFTL